MLVTSSWNFTWLSCVTLRNDVPILCIDSEFEGLASTNRKLEKDIMDLQKEKSELIDSNGQKVSRLQTQLQEQNRSNENKDDEVSLFNTEFKVWEREQYSKTKKIIQNWTQRLYLLNKNLTRYKTLVVVEIK